MVISWLLVTRRYRDQCETNGNHRIINQTLTEPYTSFLFLLRDIRHEQLAIGNRARRQLCIHCDAECRSGFSELTIFSFTRCLMLCQSAIALILARSQRRRARTVSCDSNWRGEKCVLYQSTRRSKVPVALASPAAYQSTFKLPLGIDRKRWTRNRAALKHPTIVADDLRTMKTLLPPSVELATAM